MNLQRILVKKDMHIIAFNGEDVDGNIVDLNSYTDASKEYIARIQQEVIQSYQNKPPPVLSKSKGRTVGPKRSTVLVAGDIKPPTSYKPVWHDRQDGSGDIYQEVLPHLVEVTKDIHILKDNHLI